MSNDAHQQEHVTLRGVNFAYTDQGSGPLVLNSHGTSQSHRSALENGFPNYAPVAEGGSRLISYDTRGHGGSSATWNEADYAGSALAFDMLAFADHFSPDEPVSVIGNSLGTKALLYAAIERPDRFSKLVATIPAAAWETRAAQVAEYAVWAKNAEAGVQNYLDERGTEGAADPTFAGPPTYPGGPPDVAEGLLPTIFRGVASVDMPPKEAVASITQPVLLLSWSGDSGHPVSTAIKLAELIPNSRLMIASSYEQVLKWGQIAADFLND